MDSSGRYLWFAKTHKRLIFRNGDGTVIASC
jgi:hypothetical protein